MPVFEPVFASDGDCLVRENLALALFCKLPFAEMADGVASCLEQYLQMIPEGALSWSLIGSTASTHKPLTPKDLGRCKSLLTPASAKLRDTHFRLMGRDKWGPDHAVMVCGRTAPERSGFLDQTNAIELLFPAEFLASFGEDAFVDVATKMFEALPWDSGHSGMALVPGAPSQYGEASTYMAPRLMRSHGLDIAKTPFVVNALGQRCRGARWLTLLSDPLLDQLGGRDAVARGLASGVQVIPTSRGVVMRAGRCPEIGDVNRNETTPLVASVAHAIEGVTQFHANGMLQFFGGDAEKRDRWERRFWWQSPTDAP
jgi:hypothetical protein